jgi:hypothetical protein
MTVHRTGERSDVIGNESECEESMVKANEQKENGERNKLEIGERETFVMNESVHEIANDRQVLGRQRPCDTFTDISTYGLACLHFDRVKNQFVLCHEKQSESRQKVKGVVSPTIVECEIPPHAVPQRHFSYGQWGPQECVPEKMGFTASQKRSNVCSH